MTAVPPRGGGKGKNNRPKGGQQKASQRRQQQARRNRLLGVGGIGVVVIAVVVLILVSSLSGSNGPLRTPASPAEAQTITSVPMSTLVAAKPEATRLIATCSSAGGCSDEGVSAPTGSSYPSTLAENGKPTLLYIGAEFCPICATERWPMIIALSHFGTFTNLQTTHSAKDDGNIPTWSFYGAKYTSQYLNFQTYEVETNTRGALENPPTNIVSLWQGFFGGEEEFPFIDFNQKYVFSTEQLVDTTLEGNSFSQVLGAVGNNSDTIGSQIDAAAAVFTRYLCGMTNSQPSDVCSAVSSLPLTVQQNTSGPTSTGG